MDRKKPEPSGPSSCLPSQPPPRPSRAPISALIARPDLVRLVRSRRRRPMALPIPVDHLSITRASGSAKFSRQTCRLRARADRHRRQTCSRPTVPRRISTGAGRCPRRWSSKLPTLDTAVRTELCEPVEFYLREVRASTSEIGARQPLRPPPYFASFDEATHDFVLDSRISIGRARADQNVGQLLRTPRPCIDATPATTPHWWDNDRLASLYLAEAVQHLALANRRPRHLRAAWLEFARRSRLGAVPGDA